MSSRMTGGEAIVESLLQHGVDTVFAIPGVQTYGLFDALQRAGDRIRVVGARHEQACAYMAFGYARTTARAGVFSVVPGPGVLNAAAGICSAYGASTPTLCLTGQIPSRHIGAGKGLLHELPDQLATLRTLTKWAERIEHPSLAPALVAEAFAQMHSGRPRPVALEMPMDVFTMTAPVAPLPPRAPAPPPEVDGQRLDDAARLLRDARQPMIMVGSGAQAAHAEVLELAELLQAPVVAWRGGRGVVADDHPLGMTCAAGFERWADTDVLLGIGSRLELHWQRWPNTPRALKIVNIDIDPAQVRRIAPDVALVADARAATRLLIEALRRDTPPRPSRQREFEAVKAATAARAAKVQPHMDYLAAMRRVLPRDGFFVEEICQAGFTSHFGFPVYTPRSFVACGHQGTLGFGYATSLGVKIAHPDKAVVSISGDGGFMFGVQELATAVQYGIGVVAVVFNNHAYGNVRRDQQQRFGGRVIGADLVNPDFVRLAESFGMAGHRVASPAALQAALERALGEGAPALIEVEVDLASEASPWEFLTPPPR